MKDRLGCSDFTSISCDLNALIQLVELPELDGPFTDEEIQSVVSYMPLDQAPGRDGFNGFFYKMC